MSDSFQTLPTNYKSFVYYIVGEPGQYRFVLQTPKGHQIKTSEFFPTVVATNQEVRRRIDRLVAVLLCLVESERSP
jgi:hypothetical protein